MTYSNRTEKRDNKQCPSCYGDLDSKGKCMWSKCKLNKQSKGGNK